MLALALLAPGCASYQYRHLMPGKFEGKVTVTWVEPNLFIYEPDPVTPLTYTAASGRKLVPTKMYTDGGSIPPFLWGVPGYSPWGYAPAYIIHDWLFEAHHCSYPGQGDTAFTESAELLAEGIKTLMESGKVPKDEFVEFSIYEAVSSSVAKNLWDNGACNPPAEVMGPKAATGRRVIFTLDMGK